jgi:hypothetical protein
MEALNNKKLAESDDEGLPKVNKHVMMKISNNNFLKLYRQKNATHDRDRENATSIVQNLQLPKGSEYMRNPFFNRKAQEEPMLDLSADELLNISQIP